ncbi:hypothetical protein ACTQ45_07835 [Fundicoccus sp. Sow4_D5]|uniref:hypothetical protein n=1 Tax=Fundicoccus sp. Sow4_D5 TaxID=3438782 RepID=UPI003F8DE6BC
MEWNIRRCFFKMSIGLSLVFLVNLLTGQTLLAKELLGKNEVAEFLVHGEVIDTESTMYSTIFYDIVEADLPSDRILIDESTLYNNIILYIESPEREEVYYHNYTNPTTYRDYSSWPMYYLVYDNGDMEMLHSINFTEKISDYYDVLAFLNAHKEELLHKVSNDFVWPFADDIDHLYELQGQFAPQMIADAKAAMMRAEESYAQVEEKDTNFEAATEIIEEMRISYEALIQRYNNAYSESPTFNFYKSDDLIELGTTDALIEMVKEVIDTLPIVVQRRLSNFYFVPKDEVTNVMENSSIDAYVRPTGVIYFDGELGLGNEALVYAMIAHIIDFNSYSPTSLEYTEFTSFSTSPEWLKVHNSEWYKSKDSSYFYNDSVASFAQAFAGYTLEKYMGMQMSDQGYVDEDIANRPLSKAYFDDFFERHGFNE